MKNNRIVVDLNKVQYSLFGYRNQHGNWSSTKIAYSVRGVPYDPQEQCFMSHMCMDNYAIVNCLKDYWQPELKLKVTANCMLVYTGDKAVSIYKEWCGRIFKKKG